MCVCLSKLFFFQLNAATARRDGSGFSRSSLVKEYFQCVEGFTKAEVVTEVGTTPDNSIVGKMKKFFQRSSAGRRARGTHRGTRLTPMSSKGLLVSSQWRKRFPFRNGFRCVLFK